MKSTKIVAANWKMHMTLAEGLALAKQLRAGLSFSGRSSVILLPSFFHLPAMVAEFSAHSRIAIGAQNAYWEAAGAFTGEVSVAQLASLGVDYLLIGHSERRQLFKEGASELRKKLEAALHHGLRPLLCCGEDLSTRQGGEAQAYVCAQLKEVLQGLPTEIYASLLVAYEPIWAIGTGETATPALAQQMHAAIRETLIAFEPAASEVPLLYGGSVKPDNAEALFAQKDIDGALVGGASLRASDFLAIVAASDAALPADDNRKD